MSRSNPKKKKPREVNRTLLIVGEGAADKAFLRCLKYHYSRDCGVGLVVKDGKGGSPESVLRVAIKHSKGFDAQAIVVDTDRSEEELEIARSNTEGVKVFECSGCMESLLLQMLGCEKKFNSSKDCKQFFERNYISSGDRTDARKYIKIFPLQLVEKRRKEIQILDDIINLILGDF